MTSTGQKVFSGRQSIQELAEILNRTAPKKIFLATGRSSYEKSGAKAALSGILSSANVTEFESQSSTLQMGDLQSAVDLFRSNQCDFIIGVGGGLAMDLAKAVSILASQSGDLKKFIRGETIPSPREIDLVLIPTTAGSGSEATHFSVIYIDSCKFSLAHQSMISNVVILDASLTDSLPPRLTANSGLDVLCQGVESFWSVRSTEVSRPLSTQAIDLTLNHLVNAVTAPTAEARNQMLLAANFAGQAINIAKTTAAHALSYYLTIEHQVPHGHAVALILPHLLVCNAQSIQGRCHDPRGVEFVMQRISDLLQLLQVETPEQGRHKLLSIVEATGLPTKLSQVGVTSHDLQPMKNSSLGSERAGNNPVSLGPDELDFILREAL